MSNSFTFTSGALWLSPWSYTWYIFKLYSILFYDYFWYNGHGDRKENRKGERWRKILIEKVGDNSREEKEA